jgi:hypothetical protein
MHLACPCTLAGLPSFQRILPLGCLSRCHAGVAAGAPSSLRYPELLKNRPRLMGYMSRTSYVQMTGGFCAMERTHLVH